MGKNSTTQQENVEASFNVLPYTIYFVPVCVCAHSCMYYNMGIVGFLCGDNRGMVGLFKSTLKC